MDNISDITSSDMASSRRRGKLVGAITGFLLISGGIVLSLHGVSNVVTEEDLFYIEKFLSESPVPRLPHNPSFDEEIQFIRASQAIVLAIAGGTRPIPHRSPREPKDLFLAKTGACYDRSRSLEKIFRYRGFRTRHVALYSRSHSRSQMRATDSQGGRSHAMTEVLTSRGWLAVDSNDPWMALDHDGHPRSIEDVSAHNSGTQTFVWASDLYPVAMDTVYQGPFMYVYGLYSRHGEFYPPYGPIPDIHWGEFMENFTTLRSRLSKTGTP